MADHLILKGGTWHVRLDVPLDVRGHPLFYMKKVLTKSLKTGHRNTAKDASLEILASWKRQIKEARDKKNLSTWTVQADSAQKELFNKLQLARTAKDFDSIYAQKLTATVKIMEDYDLGEEKAGELMGLMFDNTRPKTIISPTLINEFERYQEKNFVILKTAAMQASHIREIIKFLDSNNLSLDQDSIEKYLESLNISTKTKRNRIFSGNSFWEFLISKDKSIKSTPNPFKDLTPERQKKGKGQRNSNSYLAFTKQEIESLYKAATARGDTALANTIKIAAYTGCRIEEVCQLKTISSQNNIFLVENAKTTSGNREIPIHKTIAALVDDLRSNSPDGYLISSSAGNKYGNRSDSISKRFGRLKTQLGFGRDQVFHSIRKTTATLLQRADTPPLIITAIMGHKVNHITFDVYSSGPSLQQKKTAIERLDFNFE